MCVSYGRARERGIMALLSGSPGSNGETPSHTTSAPDVQEASEKVKHADQYLKRCPPHCGKTKLKGD